MSDHFVSVIFLLCNHEDHPRDGSDDGSDRYGLEHLFRRGQEQDLRKKACEDGWQSLRFPGAPWRWLDHCPAHRQEDQTPPAT
jgi:hypothetical protein